MSSFKFGWFLLVTSLMLVLVGCESTHDHWDDACGCNLPKIEPPGPVAPPGSVASPGTVEPPGNVTPPGQVESPGSVEPPGSVQPVPQGKIKVTNNSSVAVNFSVNGYPQTILPGNSYTWNYQGSANLYCSTADDWAYTVWTVQDYTYTAHDGPVPGVVDIN
jgi:hypothetical protein